MTGGLIKKRILPSAMKVEEPVGLVPQATLGKPQWVEAARALAFTAGPELVPEAAGLMFMM